MNTTDTRRLLASVALGGLCAAAVLAAPPARADAQGFLAVVDGLGFYHSSGGDGALLGLGYRVCESLASGANGITVADAIYYNTDASVSYDDAANFVIAAVENLCPENDHRGGKVVT